MAHAWVQMFDTEYDAFKTYCEIYPTNATLLVDTYNVLRHGVPDAIKVFDEVLKPMGKRPKGVRIDSGDIAYLSKKARQMLMPPVTRTAPSALPTLWMNTSCVT